MYYLSLNDASIFELTDLIEETSTKLKGETLKALSMCVQNADLDLIRKSFSSEFNTRTITLLSEGKAPMTVYDSYTILRSIATDEQALKEDPENPKYFVVLAQPSDIGTIVPQMQERISELEKTLIEITADPDPATMNLDDLRTYLINMSKCNLDNYLNENPVKSSCHKKTEAIYSCTLEKQTLLNNAIAMAEIHNKLGDEDYKVSWNVAGEECTYDWTMEELVQLAIEIEAFVKPLISQQQNMEKQIDDSKTREEMLAVKITFPVEETEETSVSK